MRSSNIKIFKFGGASVKDAASVRNVVSIVKRFAGHPLVVVVSAMGKTTNALEQVVNDLFSGSPTLQQSIQQVKDYHQNILSELFPDEKHAVHAQVNNLFVELEWVTEEAPGNDYNKVYDQVVSLGEFISTRIVAAYLSDQGLAVRWQDIRDIIKTDSNYREAGVDWDLTNSLSRRVIPAWFGEHADGVMVTQGFVGCNDENYNTTLGREGSDYSAAILAYTLDASEVSIWKDVPGVLNADPKFFPDAVLLSRISYQDAIELAYYGASVIHPKTIKPLQNKNIPLYVRSFVDPGREGTVIHSQQSTERVPSYIFKTNQVLFSVLPKDFSFIAEQNLSRIFSVFANHGVRVNIMQNSAISFSVCFDDVEGRAEKVVEALRDDFRILYNKGLKLITIRYYDQATLDKMTAGCEVLLEQRSRNTVQVVVRE